MELVHVEIEFGIIRYYNVRQNYGIIDVTDRDGTLQHEGVRFDLSTARDWLVAKNDVCFRIEPMHVYPAVYLSKGTRLVFARRNKRSTRVLCWGFRESFSAYVAELGEQSYVDFDAVTYVTGTNERVVVWSGTNDYELSIAFRKDVYDHLEFEGTYADYDDIEYDSDGMSYGVPQEWTESYDDPRVELCCIPAVYWQLHGPLGVPQPKCSHRK